MSTDSYHKLLTKFQHLTREQQATLLQELERVVASPPPPEALGLLELRGLGKEVWEGVDAQEYVRAERSSWGK